MIPYCKPVHWDFCVIHNKGHNLKLDLLPHQDKVVTLDIAETPRRAYTTLDMSPSPLRDKT